MAARSLTSLLLVNTLTTLAAFAYAANWGAIISYAVAADAVLALAIHTGTDIILYNVSIGLPSNRLLAKTYLCIGHHLRRNLVPCSAQNYRLGCSVLLFEFPRPR